MRRSGSRVVHETSPLADLAEGWRAFLSYPWVVAMVSSASLMTATSLVILALPSVRSLRPAQSPA